MSPLYLPAQVFNKQQLFQEQLSEFPWLRNLRILVVDDDQMNLIILKAKLQVRVATHVTTSYTRYNQLHILRWLLLLLLLLPLHTFALFFSSLFPPTHSLNGPLSCSKHHV
jgi:hypothetical protein